MIKVLNRDRYQGKGKPRKSDYDYFLDELRPDGNLVPVYQAIDCDIEELTTANGAHYGVIVEDEYNWPKPWYVKFWEFIAGK